MTYLKYTSLTPELYAYCQKIACRESDTLKTIGLENDNHPQIRMQISADQAQFLQFLIRSIHAESVLEIGTFMGYSAAAMALALPENGQLITCDIDAITTQIATENWDKAQLNNKIQLKLGSALESMHQLFNEGKSFDFIFIDADKGNYIQYYDMAIKLLSPKGIIAIDNVFFHGEVVSESPSKAAQHIIKFNEHIRQDPNIYLSLIPIADGLWLIRKLST
jgi:predicted O-methyltransferase YrrM